MKELGRFRESMRIMLLVASISAAAGAIYGAAIGGDSPGWGALQGIVTGVAIGMPIVAFEMFIVNSPRALPLRRLRFLLFTGLRVGVYVAIIVFGIYFGRWLFSDVTQQSLAFDREFAVTIGFSLLGSLFFNLFFVIERLLGRGVLWRFVAGRYHRPHMEYRVFLFIDLVASTEIAERIGDIAYHRLLNRFLFDLSRAQLASHGEIYKYLGDGIIVTWPRERGVRDANCLRCLHLLDAEIAQSASAYESSFGIVPDYRAGLHAGEVVAGELGDFKQEIGFLGDAINTAARIEEACRELDQRILISGSLADEIADVLPPGVTLEPMGPVRLRGKTGELPLSAVRIAVQP